ncbi:hypothetical protein C8J56DRAFT_1070515 [Mycena floridula]|nr:hypothetical protein C8J56DRAFT_1070515 [Mycena floridula]
MSSTRNRSHSPKPGTSSRKSSSGTNKVLNTFSKTMEKHKIQRRSVSPVDLDRAAEESKRSREHYRGGDDDPRPAKRAKRATRAPGKSSLSNNSKSKVKEPERVHKVGYVAIITCGLKSTRDDNGTINYVLRKDTMPTVNELQALEIHGLALCDPLNGIPINIGGDHAEIDADLRHLLPKAFAYLDAEVPRQNNPAFIEDIDSEEKRYNPRYFLASRLPGVGKKLQLVPGGEYPNGKKIYINCFTSPTKDGLSNRFLFICTQAQIDLPLVSGDQKRIKTEPAEVITLPESDNEGSEVGSQFRGSQGEGSGVRNGSPVYTRSHGSPPKQDGASPPPGHRRRYSPVSPVRPSAKPDWLAEIAADMETDFVF